MDRSSHYLISCVHQWVNSNNQQGLRFLRKPGYISQERQTDQRGVVRGEITRGNIVSTEFCWTSSEKYVTGTTPRLFVRIRRGVAHACISNGYLLRLHIQAFDCCISRMGGKKKGQMASKTSGDYRSLQIGSPTVHSTPPNVFSFDRAKEER